MHRITRIRCSVAFLGWIALLCLAALYWPHFVQAAGHDGGPQAWQQHSDLHIYVNLWHRQLYLFQNGRMIKSYRIAPGKPDTPTPIGDFRIIQKSAEWGGRFWLPLAGPQRPLRHIRHPRDQQTSPHRPIGQQRLHPHAQPGRGRIVSFGSFAHTGPHRRTRIGRRRAQLSHLGGWIPGIVGPNGAKPAESRRLLSRARQRNNGCGNGRRHQKISGGSSSLGHRANPFRRLGGTGHRGVIMWTSYSIDHKNSKLPATRRSCRGPGPLLAFLPTNR